MHNQLTQQGGKKNEMPRSSRESGHPGVRPAFVAWSPRATNELVVLNSLVYPEAVYMFLGLLLTGALYTDKHFNFHKSSRQ
jgi:hypothetical protein